jgi:hypothetical protein
LLRVKCAHHAGGPADCCLVKRKIRKADTPLSRAIRAWGIGRSTEGQDRRGFGTSDIRWPKKPASGRGDGREVVAITISAWPHSPADEQPRHLVEARVVVAAGMEGALPSVVGGLVSCPVIAVPTSVGYGASFNGLAALLGMLNSCASNVTVVNIDNGFGAGYAASQINALCSPP